eukprot:c52283_g1_i1 orf=237-404(+)
MHSNDWNPHKLHQLFRVGIEQLSSWAYTSGYSTFAGIGIARTMESHEPYKSSPAR